MELISNYKMRILNSTPFFGALNWRWSENVIIVIEEEFPALEKEKKRKWENVSLFQAFSH